MCNAVARLVRACGPPSIETAMRRIRDDDLYLCTRHFAIRFTHCSYMDRFYPHRTPNNLWTTSYHHYHTRICSPL